jgi:hypothetical protein
MTYTQSVAAGSEEMPLSVTDGENTIFIWAYGSSDTFALHTARGDVSIDLRGSAAATGTYTHHVGVVE